MIESVKTIDCIAFYGSRAKLADALGLKPPSVYGWKECPPPLRQIQLEGLTDGALKAESRVFETAKRLTAAPLAPSLQRSEQA